MPKDLAIKDMNRFAQVRASWSDSPVMGSYPKAPLPTAMQIIDCSREVSLILMAEMRLADPMILLTTCLLWRFMVTMLEQTT